MTRAPAEVSRRTAGWTLFVLLLVNVLNVGDRTLLDNTLIFAHSETEFAKFHSIDNIPMMTAGRAGGKVKSGLHIDGNGQAGTRLGYTLQRLYGVSLGSWGTQSMQAAQDIGDMLA